MFRLFVILFCLVAIQLSLYADDSPTEKQRSDDSATDRVLQLLRSIDGCNLGMVVSEYEKETDPELIGRYGALIVCQSNPDMLFSFSESEHLGLAFLSEWELVRRQNEGLMLAQDNNGVRRAPESNEQGNGFTPEQKETLEKCRDALFRKFLDWVKLKVDVPLPDAWSSAVLSMSVHPGPSSVYPSEDKYFEARRAMLDHSETIQIDAATSIATVQGVKGLEDEGWSISSLSQLSDETLVNFAIKDDVCVFIWHADDDSFLDLQIAAVKRGRAESLWERKSFNRFPDASKSYTTPLAFPVISKDKMTVTTFHVNMREVGIDVLDLRNGKRKWCFSSKLARQLGYGSIME